MRVSAAKSKFLAAWVLLAFSGPACTVSGAADRGGQPVAFTATTSTTVAPTTTTTTAPTTTTTIKPIPPGLGQGSRGPDVQTLEQRLTDLRYDAGKVDGVFDSTTQHAVMAFQKVQGLSRTGRATADVVNLMNTVGPPGPMLPSGGANRIEVDLKRQVLLLYRDGNLNKVLSVSTGSGKRYCVDGECARAVTPGGSFRVTRRIPGWRTSRLGKLYNPLYFNGGIAIHGAPSVPGYPASHGCVRIPMSAAAWFPGMVPNGTPVYVIGGPRAPVPFNEPAPGDPTTTTTSSTTSSSSTSTTNAPVPVAPTSSSTTSTSTTSTTVKGDGPAE
ncbi:MAG TPA: L,D-transpeptidase family protein [Acidimicrobiales bacterium]|nr:L,D-transpeptidase family protein [Acidimicrobiales bacterium]